MTIAHITIYPPKASKHSDNIGGVASYSKNLITTIDYNDQDKVYVLTHKEGERQVYNEDGLEIIRCWEKKPKYIFQILKELKRIKPDVIHIQQELHLFGGILNASLLSLLLLILIRKQTVITLHGVVPLSKINKSFVKENNSGLPPFVVKIAFYMIYKPICIFVKRIVVHEEYFKEILKREYHVKDKKIIVVPHGVEDFKMINKSEAREKLNISNEKQVVLFMGYLTGYKGIDLLVEGFSIYAKQNPNAFLVLGAGKHPKLQNDPKYLKNEYNRLVDKAKEMISESQYQWQGFIKEDEIQAYYSAADVFITPYTIAMSSSGPMSISIGFGLPFVASDVFDHVVENKDWIFERTPESLAACLDRFFKKQEVNDEIMDKMKQRMLWSTLGKEYYKLYSSLQK